MLLMSIARNLAGGLLILVGIILLPVPILSGWALIIPGIILLDFPGKSRVFARLERTRFVSGILAKSPTLAQLWKRLYDRTGSGQSKTPTGIM